MPEENEVQPIEEFVGKTEEPKPEPLEKPEYQSEQYKKLQTKLNRARAEIDELKQSANKMGELEEKLKLLTVLQTQGMQQEAFSSDNPNVKQQIDTSYKEIEKRYKAEQEKGEQRRRYEEIERSANEIRDRAETVFADDDEKYTQVISYLGQGQLAPAEALISRAEKRKTVAKPVEVKTDDVEEKARALLEKEGMLTSDTGGASGVGGGAFTAERARELANRDPSKITQKEADELFESWKKTYNIK